MKKKLVFIIGLILLNSCIRIDTGKSVIRKMSYKGIITKIYRDESNHNMNTFVIQENNYYFENVADLFPKSWEYAQIGDSIIKPVDTLMIIIKKNDSTYSEFFYEF